MLLKTHNFSKNYIFQFLLATMFSLIILSDQIAKEILASNNRYNLIVISGFFEIKTFFNYNLSFLNFVFLPVIAYILATFIILIFFYKYIYSPLKTNKDINVVSLKIGATLISSGALSNLIDRISHGYVIDYFFLKWPVSTVFNIADIAILIGSILLIREIIKTKL